MTPPMLLAAALVVAMRAPAPSEMSRVSDALILVAEPSTSIGVATMEPDGTIVLWLRAVSPKAMGDALLRYAPDHPQYKAVRDHLPSLKPGDSIPVPPFS